MWRTLGATAAGIALAALALSGCDVLRQPAPGPSDPDPVMPVPTTLPSTPAECADIAAAVEPFFDDVRGLKSIEVEACTQALSYTVTAELAADLPAQAFSELLDAHRKAWEAAGLAQYYEGPILESEFGNFQLRLRNGLAEPDGELPAILETASQERFGGIVNVDMQSVDSIFDVIPDHSRVFVDVHEDAFAVEKNRRRDLEDAWNLARDLTEYLGYENVEAGFSKRLGTTYMVPVPTGGGSIPDGLVDFFLRWDDFAARAESYVGDSAVDLRGAIRGGSVVMEIDDTSEALPDSLINEFDSLADELRGLGYEVDSEIRNVIIE